MNFKQYRINKGLTQDQAADLIGMSGSYWSTLEAGQQPQDKVRAFARVLTCIDHQDIDKPIDFVGMATVLTYGLSFKDASAMIGAGDSTWSSLANGHLPAKRRWIRSVNALLIELAEKQADLDLTPGGEIEVLMPQVLTPEPEAPVVEEEISDQPGLIPFAYGSQKIRMKWINGEPWFCLVDICKAINYESSHNAASLIDEDELQKLGSSDSMGRAQLYWFTSEAGMYQFLGSTHTEAAKPFRKWVNKEVLPTIRKTGSYAAAPAQIDPIDAAILSLQRIKQIEAQQAQLTATIASQAQQIERLKQQAPVDIDKAALQTLQKLQALEARKNELQNLVAQVVNAADQSKHIIASNYCSYQAVWRAVFNASNPPVNKLAGYTSLAQINTGIAAAKQLLETLQGKPIAEQLKIEIEGDAA